MPAIDMTSGARRSAFIGFLFAMGSVAQAPHSTAAYDTMTITLKNAIVKRLVWANPHCVLWFDVKDDRGRVTTWGIESGSPSALSRVGWHRNSLKPGDAIAVEILPPDSRCGHDDQPGQHTQTEAPSIHNDLRAVGGNLSGPTKVGPYYLWPGLTSRPNPLSR